MLYKGEDRRGKRNPMYGRKQTTTAKEKMSVSAIRAGTGKWMKGREPREGFVEMARKPKSPEHKENIRRALTGKKKSPEHIKNLSGEKSSQWQGGISKSPYPKEFNQELKLKIRTRDNFTCCLCNRTEREELEEAGRVLSVNHIDFDKNNLNENNLNTLCRRCNIKINNRREYWTDYFRMYE